MCDPSAVELDGALAVALIIDRRDRAVLDVARGLLSDLDVEVVLERLLEAARELTSAQYAAIGILNEAGSGLARFVTLGIDEETRRAIGTLPTGRGLLGELIAHPQPLRVADLGLHPRSYGFPLGHPPMRTFLGVPVSVDGEPFGNIYVTEKLDGDEFTKADEEALVVLAAFAGLAVDHARRYTGAETQRHDLARTVAALDASIQISRALGAETSLDAILELVAKRGRALVGARALVIEQLDGDQLVISVGAGEVPDGVIGERTPVSGTVASIALATGESQHLNDEMNRARFDEHGLGRFGMPGAVGLFVPLTHGGAGYGVLVALDRTDGEAPFTREEQRLLESFASSAASAVASARSASREQHRQRVAAAEAERTRWARELHDETLQGLASLRLMLGAVQRAEGEERRRQAIDQSITHIEQEIATLRSLITELRPAALDELGTEAAVRALADRTAAQGLAVDLDIRLAHEQRGAQRHVGELETAIYRIVQEALTNARKHGGAKRAAVEIIDLDRSVRITVRDNGSGFDPASKTDGYGILGMRERAQLLGGTLDIASTPGEETTLTAVLPLHRRLEPGEPVADQGRRSG